jgi:hypothetical protein
MPVQRFRTFREARLAQWMSPDDPRLAERIRRWWRISAALSPVQPPRGVRKFRTIEEANAERDAWPRHVWPKWEG